MNSIRPYSNSEGFEGLELKHDSGSALKILMYGAHICSWTINKQELLFMSNTAQYAHGKAIRGGIPIIFPQFSRRGSLPAHGFARTAVWKLVNEKILDDFVAVYLELLSNDQTKSLWPHDFKATLAVELSQELSLTLKITNTGSSPLLFADAFHTYFKVDDISHVLLKGLKGSAKIDFLDSEKSSKEDRSEISFNQAIDTAYHNTPSVVQLCEGKKVLEISKNGMNDIVVWNPWEEGNSKMQDLHPEAWRNMICVEVANALKPVELHPGNTFESTQRIELQQN